MSFKKRHNWKIVEKKKRLAGRLAGLEGKEVMKNTYNTTRIVNSKCPEAVQKTDCQSDGHDVVVLTRLGFVFGNLLHVFRAFVSQGRKFLVERLLFFRLLHQSSGNSVHLLIEPDR